MSDELFLNGKTYVSSKKAATETGYARDYIGQLARGGQIDAERVGGLWYVSMESLHGYEKNAEVAKTFTPITGGSKDAESALSFEGKEYISASRAAKATGYNQDYVGQLARGGKIPSRQIGNRWYVDHEALVKHKAEKDALLAAVQAQSVGMRHEIHQIPVESMVPAPVAQARMPLEHVLVLPPIKYTQEDRDLIPTIPEKSTSNAYPMSNLSEIRPVNIDERQSIASHDVPVIQRSAYTSIARPQKAVKRSRKALTSASVGVLTIILVLSVGLITMKDTATFAHIKDSDQLRSMSASATEAVGKAGDIIEDLVSPMLIYNRGQ